MELVQDRASRTFFEPSLNVGAFLVQKAQENGLILRVLPGDIIAFCPPLIIIEEELKEMFNRFGQALKETAEQFS